MPSLLELSGLLGEFGRGRYLDAVTASKAAAKTKIPNQPMNMQKMPAERQMDVAERLAAKGARALAMNWAIWAREKAKVEKNKKVLQQAEALIKRLRGEAAVSALAGLGDIDGIVMGRMMGLW